MAHPPVGPRELVIHTGQDPTLISRLAAEAEANQRQLRHRGISLQPSAALVPAVLRNDWGRWRWRERRRLWKPWRRDENVWAVAPALVKPLLQQRRLHRIRQQVEAMGFQLSIVVHLLDAREQLARDYARTIVNLRWRGSISAYAARQLERDPLRYRVDRRFEPLLEWCGARGLRFVRHGPGHALGTTWSTLERLGGAAPAGAVRPTATAGWIAPDPWHSDLSHRRVLLSRWILEALEHSPRGKERQRLLALLDSSLAGSPHPAAEVTSWAEALGMGAVPEGVLEAQQRLGLKVWGIGWPRDAEAGPQPQVPTDELTTLGTRILALAQATT